MKFSSIVCYLSAAFFVFYGLAFAVQPLLMMSLTTGVESATASSLVDVRATYGGLSIAVGVAMVFVYHRVSVTHCMNLIALVLLCMAAARGLGFLLDGPANALMVVYFVAEILGAGLALISSKIESK